MYVCVFLESGGWFWRDFVCVCVCVCGRMRFCDWV